MLHVMKKLSHKIKNKRILWLIVFLFWLVFMVGSIKAQDLLEQAFQPAVSRDQVIDLWNTKNAVWNEILRESVDVSVDFARCRDTEWQALSKDNKNIKSEQDCISVWWIRDDTFIDQDTRQPLIVRIAKILLRITVVISITMVLYNWIIFIVQWASGKELSQIEAKKNLLYVVWWLLLALFSLAIINLISSIWLSTILKEPVANTQTKSTSDPTSVNRSTDWWSRDITTDTEPRDTEPRDNTNRWPNRVDTQQ